MTQIQHDHIHEGRQIIYHWTSVMKTMQSLYLSKQSPLNTSWRGVLARKDDSFIPCPWASHWNGLCWKLGSIYVPSFHPWTMGRGWDFQLPGTRKSTQSIISLLLIINKVNIFNVVSQLEFTCSFSFSIWMIEPTTWTMTSRFRGQKRLTQESSNHPSRNTGIQPDWGLRQKPRWGIRTSAASKEFGQTQVQIGGQHLGDFQGLTKMRQTSEQMLFQQSFGAH